MLAYWISKRTDSAAVDLYEDAERPLVLVAEDDDDFRAVLTAALQRIGLRVTAVDNGNALVDALGRAANGDAPPDLVITDNNMPGCNGIDALEVMHLAGIYTPAIVITGMHSSAVEEAAQRLGAIAVLQKPIDMDELRDSIMSALP